MSDNSNQTNSSVRGLITPFVDEIGGPLTALRSIVIQHGYIDAEASACVADVFNLSHAEVRGIVSFYTDLRTTPPPRHTIRICQAEACQSVGSRELTRRLTSRFGVELGQTNSAGSGAGSPQQAGTPRIRRLSRTRGCNNRSNTGRVTRADHRCRHVRRTVGNPFVFRSDCST